MPRRIVMDYQRAARRLLAALAGIADPEAWRLSIADSIRDAETRAIRAEQRVKELREALTSAGRLLGALSDLARTYPRPSNDPNSRVLLDLYEMPKHGAAEFKALLARLDAEDAR